MLEKVNGVKFVPALAGLALACVVFAIVALILDGRQSGADVEHLRKLSQLVAISQKMPSQAAAAVAGKAQAFDELAKSRTRYHSLVTELSEAQKLGASDALQTQVQTILNGREAMASLQKAVVDVHALLPHLLQSLGNVAATSGPATAEQLAPHLERFELTAQRIEMDLQAFANGAEDSNTLVRRLTDGLQYMGQVLGGVAGRDSGLGVSPVSAASQAGLQQTQKFFEQLSAHVRNSTAAAPQLAGMRTAAAGLERSADQLYTSLNGEVDVAAEKAGLPGTVLALVALGVALITLAAIAMLSRSARQLRQQVEVQTNKNQRNQEAILRLLDELSSLADGEPLVPIAPPLEPGHHGYLASDPEMDAVFIAYGKGVKPGTRLDTIRNVDVAATIASLLGLKMDGIAGRPVL